MTHTAAAAVAPKDAEYPHVPTPKELELARLVVDLQQEKDAVVHKLMSQIQDLESQIHKLQVRLHDNSQQLQATKREQIQREQDAIEQERTLWRAKVRELENKLDQEQNDKEVQKKWRAKFVQPSIADITTDSNTTTTNHSAAVGVDDWLDDALAKFAQSIALLPARVATKATQAGVLPFLVHLLRENLSDLVTGSVLLALVHLAIYQKPQRMSRYTGGHQIHSDTGIGAATVNVKDEIIKAGAAAPLSRILETNKNQCVLCEAARLCAALSSFVPNKRVLAAKNIVRFLIRILTPGCFRGDGTSTSALHHQPETEDNNASNLPPLDTARLEKLPIEIACELQRFALSALVNLSHDSEIIRSQIVNFHFIPIAVRYLHEATSGVFVQTEAAKLLGNLAFNHIVNQSAILTAEGDAILTTKLTSQTLEKSAFLVHAAAVGLGNLAYSSVNQLSIGYGDAMTFLLQLLVDSKDPRVVEASCGSLSGICHTNPLNKSRAMAQNGLQVLLYVVSRSHRYNHDHDALVAALECLAVLARGVKQARHQMLELDGHVPLCQLCMQTKRSCPAVLIASAMALCVLIPTPQERQLLLTDSKESKLETNGMALSALKRVRHLIYKSQDKDKEDKEKTVTGALAVVVPLWLEQAITRLEKYAAATGRPVVLPEEEEEEPTGEYHDRSYYSMESLTEIEPDDLCPAFYG